MRNTQIALIFSLIFLSACAHHKDVRPGTDTHKVSVQSDNNESGTREAISQANHYCESRGQSAVFLNEKNEYTGDMDEENYKTGKKMSDAAILIGGATSVFGGRKEKSLGRLGLLGGAVGNQVLGEGYTVTMQFKCL